MSVTLEQLESWLIAPSETEHLEFKEAKNLYKPVKLFKYCVALALMRAVAILSLVLQINHLGRLWVPRPFRT